MNKKKLWEKWIYPTCLIYTVFVVCFLILANLLNDGEVVPALTLRNAFCFLGFSLGFSAINLLLHMPWGVVTRYVLHGAALLLDFILFVLVLPGNISGGFAILTFSLFFLLFYVIIMTLKGLLFLARREKENSKKEYTDAFSGK